MKLSHAEWNVAITGATVIAAYLLWRRFTRWFWKPTTPDPWGAEVAEALDSPDATPICPHCQTPHGLDRWFCSECGRAVGDYNNVNPYLYLFSLGEVLREGTSGRVRKTWLTVAGYLTLSLAEYAVFAPVYWFFLFRNLMRQDPPAAAKPVPPAIPH